MNFGIYKLPVLDLSLAVELVLVFESVSQFLVLVASVMCDASSTIAWHKYASEIHYYSSSSSSSSTCQFALQQFGQ